MAEEKLRILKMLSEGKISPEDAEKLLNAVEDQAKPADSGSSLIGSMENKYLYVQIDPKEGKNSERVSVKVPLALLKAGLNIAGLIPKDAQEKIHSSMEEKGFSFDFSDMSPESIREIMAALEELTVDIDTDDATIQVFCK
jgi:hypothetical protein